MHRKSKNFERLMGNGYCRQPGNNSFPFVSWTLYYRAEIYTFLLLAAKRYGRKKTILLLRCP